MKLLLIAILSIWCQPSEKSHDAVIAVFKIYQEKGLSLEVIFDIEDYTSINEVRPSEVTQKHLSSYLNSKTKISIDSHQLDIKVQSIVKDRDHFRASCTIANTPTQISTLLIQNEFLLEVADHSNIMMIDINKTTKDFRMTEERTELMITY